MNNNSNNYNTPEEEDEDEDEDDSDFLALSLGLRRHRRQPPPPRPPPPTDQLSQPQAKPQIPVHSQLMQSLYYPNPNAVLIQPPSNPTLYMVQPEVLVIPSPPPPQQQQQPRLHSHISEPLLGQGRARRNGPRNNNNGEDNYIAIEPPYPWATDRPAIVHNMTSLKNEKIDTITGTVRCNKCNRDYQVGFNLEQKMAQFWSFVLSQQERGMNDRAVQEWSSPPTLTCMYCSADGVKPVIAEDKERINWLFLFLGQMLGHCTLEQLKYFCGCTYNHRTGAKDRVLYLAYREIWRQLLPDAPRDPW